MVDEMTLDVEVSIGENIDFIPQDISQFAYIIKRMKLDFQEKIDELRHELDQKVSRDEMDNLRNEFSEEDLESPPKSKTDFRHSVLNGSGSFIRKSKVVDENDPILRHELEQDFFTVMMFTKTFSWTWVLGVSGFTMQFILGVLTVIDQTSGSQFGTTLNIPVSSETNIRIAQVLVLMLSAFSQTDVLVGLRNLYLLPYSKKDHWGALLGKENEQTFGLWFCRILIPMMLKMTQGALILFATFLIIVQSDNTVDLLKDFSALFVISSVDDLFFLMADIGYFGRSLSKKTLEIKEKSNIEIRGSSKTIIDDLNRKLGYRQIISLFFINSVMLGGWIFITINQEKQVYFDQMYPQCSSTSKILAGNGVCDFRRGQGTNILECGWDGDDCTDLNDRFPDCDVPDFKRLGDNICDEGEYNSMTCGFDNGDCLLKNNIKMSSIPDCPADKPGLIGNGFCDGGAYNTPECNFDMGDCTNCVVEDIFLLQNGFCNGGFYAIDECSQDGGDCEHCTADDIFKISDGVCDEGNYNSEECSYDGGDCIPAAKRVGEEFRGIQKWWGAVVGDNGLVYGFPYEAGRIFSFDPTTSSTKLLGDDYGIHDVNKWSSAVKGHDGYIYGVPYRYNAILRFDPVTEKTSLVAEGHKLLLSDEKFGSGVVADNGIIYFIPYSYNRVVRFNASNIENPLTEIGDDLGDDPMKWWTGIIGVDGNIYGIPIRKKNVLRINIIDDTLSFFGDEDPDAELMKYFGGTLAKDGNIYACPWASQKILEINTEKESTRLVGPDFGENVWCGGLVERDDGFLYGPPAMSTSSIIRFDPRLQTATRAPMDETEFPRQNPINFGANDFRWGYPSVLGNDNNIYSVPLSEFKVLSIAPVVSTRLNSTK